MEPGKSVAVFESASIGAGSSGHTGGLTLAETAAGDLPGLGDGLAGFSAVPTYLDGTADGLVRGGWERERGRDDGGSPIRWSDSGQLRVAREVSGGTTNPGKLITGLAGAALRH